MQKNLLYRIIRTLHRNCRSYSDQYSGGAGFWQ